MKQQTISADHVYYFQMKLAGVNIEVECKNGREYSKCKPYLASFETPEIVVGASEEEIIERQKTREQMLGRPISEADEVEGIESQIIYEKIVGQMIQHKILLMHGSVVALENCACMFTAPSGVGKTTRTRLWLQEYPSSFVVNGDKPLIRVDENEVIACGTPWCGKEGWNKNVMIPLQAIFLLERVDNDRDSSIKEVSFTEALPMLLSQTYCPSGLGKICNVVRLLRDFDGKVKFYLFRSTPTLDSIRLAHDAIYVKQ